MLLHNLGHPKGTCHVSWKPPATQQAISKAYVLTTSTLPCNSSECNNIRHLGDHSPEQMTQSTHVHRYHLFLALDNQQVCKVSSETGKTSLQGSLHMHQVESEAVSLVSVCCNSNCIWALQHQHMMQNAAACCIQCVNIPAAVAGIIATSQCLTAMVTATTITMMMMSTIAATQHIHLLDDFWYCLAATSSFTPDSTDPLAVPTCNSNANTLLRQANWTAMAQSTVMICFNQNLETGAVQACGRVFATNQAKCTACRLE